jgi:two-component system nitrate/nitrite response regulator NarL
MKVASFGRVPLVRSKLPWVPTAIVDAAAVFRLGVAHICSGSRFRVTFEYANLKGFPTDFFTKGLNQIIIVSLDDGNPDILQQIQTLKSQRQSLCVCVLSDRPNPVELFAAIEANVDGFLLKDEIRADTLLRSLELILHGQTIISSRLMCTIRNALLPAGRGSGEGWRCLESRKSPPVLELEEDCRMQLSDREWAILRQLTLGASNKRIARDLGVAEATIKVHIRSLLRKVRVKNRTQAAMWAMNRLGSVVQDAVADHGLAGASTNCLVKVGTAEAIQVERA